MDLCMTAWTERKHQVQLRLSWHPMAPDDRAFVPSRCVADAATAAVTLENHFSETPEILLVLSLQCVAGCTKTQSKHLALPARTMHDCLAVSLQFPAPAAYLYKVCRLMPNSPAKAVFDSPVANRRRSSCACKGVKECFRPVYAPSRSFASAIPSRWRSRISLVRTGRRHPSRSGAGATSGSLVR